MDSKAFLNRLVARLLGRGPDDPRAPALGAIIADALKEKAGPEEAGKTYGSNGYRVGDSHAQG